MYVTLLWTACVQAAGNKLFYSIFCGVSGSAWRAGAQTCNTQVCMSVAAMFYLWHQR